MLTTADISLYLQVAAASGLFAAVVTAINALVQIWLNRKKEVSLKKLDQQFAERQRIAKEDFDDRQRKQKEQFDGQEREAAEGHTKQLQSIKEEHDKQLARLNALYASEARKESEYYDQRRVIFTSGLAVREGALKSLRVAVRNVFDVFESLIEDSPSLSNHAIFTSVSACLTALSELDKAVQAFEAATTNLHELAVVNRLRMARRFFLGILLDTSRTRAERNDPARVGLLQAHLAKLKRRRAIATRHILRATDPTHVASALLTKPGDAQLPASPSTNAI